MRRQPGRATATGARKSTTEDGLVDPGVTRVAVPVAASRRRRRAARTAVPRPVPSGMNRTSPLDQPRSSPADDWRRRAQREHAHASRRRASRPSAGRRRRTRSEFRRATRTAPARRRCRRPLAAREHSVRAARAGCFASRSAAVKGKVSPVRGDRKVIARANVPSGRHVHIEGRHGRRGARRHRSCEPCSNREDRRAHSG